ncbi:MAG: MFS transporter [Anaerolineae bacterium]|nr:MFS transporter [Anaerolineae bacterium]
MSVQLERAFPLPSGQRRNILFVALDGAVVGLMSAAASFVSVWVIRLGASPLWVSLLSSLPSTIALAMTIPWSAFAGRRRSPLRVFAFARLAVHAVYPLIAIVPFFLSGEWAAHAIILIWAMSAFPSSLSNMMFTLVMGSAVPPEQRSLLMSRRWTVLGVAKLVALPLISQMIDRLPFPYGYQLAFAINALLAGGAFFLGMQLEVAEREPAAPQKGAPLVERARRTFYEVWAQKPFVVSLTGRGLLHLGLTLVSAVVPIYWVEQLQASDTWVGYFNSALSAATLLAYFPWVRVKRKYGTRWTLVPSVVGAALYPGLMALARSPAGVLPAIALNGVVGAGTNLAFFDTLLEACPPKREAQFVAINLTVIHLVGVIGPTVGAVLLNMWPIRVVLLSSTIVALGGAAVFAFVRPVPRPGRRPASLPTPANEEAAPDQTGSEAET